METKNREMVYMAVIAALYLVITAVIAPIGFSNLQFRLSELLCLWAIDHKYAVYGVSLGCFFSNLMFGNLGLVDLFVGTLASFLGCLLAYVFRDVRISHLPLVSVFCIIVVNMLVVGMELGILLFGSDWSMWLFCILEIGISETMVCAVLGLPIYKKLQKGGFL